MKIKDVEAIDISYTFDERYETIAPLWVGRSFNTVLVRVETDEGITGIGETYPVGAVPVVSTIISRGLKPLLVGEDPLQIGRLWEKMYRGTRGYGRKGAAIIALSGVDIALWDILGKALNTPLYQLLGGSFRDRLRCYASLPPYGGDPTEEVVRRVKEGYEAVKIKAWYPNELEYIGRVRDAIGPEVELLVDANCYYDRRTAFAAARECEEHDVFWLEEPFPPDDVDGMVELTSSVDVQIAAGENEYTRFGFRELIERHAVDILMPDVERSGGVTEYVRIAAMASAFHMPCDAHIFEILGVALAASLHLSAAVPNSLFAETFTTAYEMQKEFLVEPFEAKNGYFDLPKGPGLGVELNEKAIDIHRC
ncbi:MAG: mandelate racemase/muconate lactonizing enzyme family protein [Candidatus Bathyarchaeia archaeon]